jgi:PBP1b-binding outer membrane lipoprotein LpoB
MKKLLSILFCCVLLSGCVINAQPQTIIPTDTVKPTDATESTETQTDPTEKPVTFTVYTPDENLIGFIATEVTASRESALDALIAAGVLNEGITVNSFELDGKLLKLDLNSAFADLINQQGSTGERMVMGSLVNTYLSAYQAETVLITVEGQILESGHVIYDFPMGFFE